MNDTRPRLSSAPRELRGLHVHAWYCGTVILWYYGTARCFEVAVRLPADSPHPIRRADLVHIGNEWC